MSMTEAEKQMLMDIRRELAELKRESTRIRKGVVTEVGPVLKVQLGGECGGTEITAIANGPVEVNDVVTILEGGGGALVTGMAQTGGQATLEQGPGIVIDGKHIEVDGTVARKDGSGHLIDVANPVDPTHGVNKFYVDVLAGLILGVLPEVATLPDTPLNGYTVLYNGWLCRYDSSAPFPSLPWAVIGGRDLAVQSGGASDTFTMQNAGGSYAAPKGGTLSHSLPAGIWGIFDVTIGAKYLSSANSRILFHSYSLGSTNPNDEWAVAISNQDANGLDLITSMEITSRVNVPDPGAGQAVIAERVRQQGSGGQTGMTNKLLRVKPVYIGT